MQRSVIICCFQFYILFVPACAGQSDQSISLGELYEELKYIDVSKTEPLTWRKCPSFSFKNFKAIEGAINATNFFELGYDKKGKLREIVHRETKDSLTNYRMVVFDFPRCRVLTLGSISNEEGYSYSSVVFVMDKRTGLNFMVNTAETLSTSMILDSVGGIVYKGIESLSVIMLLDSDFFPTYIFRISEGRIVFQSQVQYRNGGEIEYEQARLFLSQRDRDDLKIGPSVCPSDLEDKLSDEYEDMDFRLYPIDAGALKFAPLWIGRGFPNYR